MANISWSTASDGFWNATSSWTPTVPVTGDDVFITAVGTSYVVLLAESTAAINSLTITSADANLTLLSTGTLDVTGGATDTLAVDAGKVQLDGGSVTATDITVGGAGSLSGEGVVTGALSGSGSVVADGGVLKLETAIDGSTGLQFTIANSASNVLEVDAAIGGGNTFTFQTFAPGFTQEFAYNSATAITENIVGLNVGSSTTNPTNFIDFRAEADLTVTAGEKGSGTAGTVTLSDGSTLTLTGITDSGIAPNWFVNTASDGAGGTEVFLALCFTAGTRIATPQGEVPVEQLAAGDQVLTASGVSRPIEWIGVGQVLATRGRRTAATPVIVRKGALADNVPHRDLRVTKGHSLFIDGVLIPVEFLVNHRSILWDDRAQEVSIYHLELATHDVLVADGAPAESYRDDGNRWLFRNANPSWHLPPQEPCAPVLTGGPVVDAVWQRLLERSGPRPGLPLTGAPDLHLVVDGQRIDADGTVFHLPGLTREVRIVSRASAPAELGLSRDPRVLGIAVRSITIRAGTYQCTVEASDASLCKGFHDYEPDEGIRWTTGDALLPAKYFSACAAPFSIEITTAGMTRYLDEGTPLAA